MANSKRSDELTQLLGFAPFDLLAYFDEIEKNPLANVAERRDVNLLPFDAARKLSRTFLDFHPVIQTLGGVVLDDPNTSDHHFYLAASPLAGSVLYLAHDGDTRVVYSSLNEFIAAIRSAESHGYIEWDEIHPMLTPMGANQSQLSSLASQALESSQTEVLTAIIPSLDFRDTELLRRLVADRDFFIAEAVAIEIEKRPSIEFGWLANLCAAHFHVQAANAGRRAQAKIEQIR